ncbi:hypothetical protein FBD94_11950 [Pedobacter hiemivivus]|uniref:Uncharacterized protein n=1 Tax=Pedobacter hiemivivus TaxID=2530454 RepID=A0A4U1GBD0_9SPHI|nr:IPT/TIG domain-containing protein [Pedobacter hiemivivus]TKC61251.1 hypothetical protein FBD94_11950 [Pedobacter hiemivivus]
MKNLINNRLPGIIVILVAFILVCSSCKKNNEEGVKAAPEIERVRTLTKNDTTYTETRVNLDSNKFGNVITKVPYDANVPAARWNGQYILMGQNLLTTISIKINGVAVFFNPVFVTENSLIFVVGTDVPYGPTQSNKLTLTTKYGTVEYDFGLLQPYPVITKVAPLLGEVGGVITVTGTYFENLTGVKFGTVDAEIVGVPTKTEIKVKIPAGVSQASITVTTAGGSAVSTNSFFAFKKLLYDDAWATGMTSYGGWGGTGDIANTTGGVRGTKSIKFNYTGYDCPLQFAYTGPTLNLSNYTALKLSIYGGTGSAGKTVKVELNGVATVWAILTLTEGTFTDYVIPLSTFPAAVNFTKIWVVENSNSKAPIYIDEIGFL